MLTPAQASAIVILLLLCVLTCAQQKSNSLISIIAYSTCPLNGTCELPAGNVTISEDIVVQNSVTLEGSKVGTTIQIQGRFILGPGVQLTIRNVLISNVTIDDGAWVSLPVVNGLTSSIHSGSQLRLVNTTLVLQQCSSLRTLQRSICGSVGPDVNFQVSPDSISTTYFEQASSNNSGSSAPAPPAVTAINLSVTCPNAATYYNEWTPCINTNVSTGSELFAALRPASMRAPTVYINVVGRGLSLAGLDPIKANYTSGVNVIVRGIPRLIPVAQASRTSTNTQSRFAANVFGQIGGTNGSLVVPPEIDLAGVTGMMHMYASDPTGGSPFNVNIEWRGLVFINPPPSTVDRYPEGLVTSKMYAFDFARPEGSGTSGSIVVTMRNCVLVIARDEFDYLVYNLRQWMLTRATSPQFLWVEPMILSSYSGTNISFMSYPNVTDPWLYASSAKFGDYALTYVNTSIASPSHWSPGVAPYITWPEATDLPFSRLTWPLPNMTSVAALDTDTLLDPTATDSIFNATDVRLGDQVVQRAPVVIARTSDTGQTLYGDVYRTSDDGVWLDMRDAAGVIILPNTYPRFYFWCTTLYNLPKAVNSSVSKYNTYKSLLGGFRLWMWAFDFDRTVDASSPGLVLNNCTLVLPCLEIAVYADIATTGTTRVNIHPQAEAALASMLIRDFQVSVSPSRTMISLWRTGMGTNVGISAALQSGINLTCAPTRNPPQAPILQDYLDASDVLAPGAVSVYKPSPPPSAPPLPLPATPPPTQLQSPSSSPSPLLQPSLLPPPPSLPSPLASPASPLSPAMQSPPPGMPSEASTSSQTKAIAGGVGGAGAALLLLLLAGYAFVVRSRRASGGGAHSSSSGVAGKGESGRDHQSSSSSNAISGSSGETGGSTDQQQGSSCEDGRLGPTSRDRAASSKDASSHVISIGPSSTTGGAPNNATATGSSSSNSNNRSGPKAGEGWEQREPEQQTPTNYAGDFAGKLQGIQGEAMRKWHVTLEHKLGQGTYGVVYKGRWRGMNVAAKHIIVPALPGEEGERRRRQALSEAAITAALNHPNVIATYHFNLDPLYAPHQTVAGPNTVSGGQQQPGQGVAINGWQLQMLQEYADAGSLLDVVEGTGRHHGEKLPHISAMVRILLDVAKGMESIHSKGVTHGDLKLENILLRTQADASWGPSLPSFPYVAKIADFGLGMLLPANRTHASGVRVGTPLYMAPEVIQAGRMSPKADTYSFGVVAFELYSAKTAWKTMLESFQHLPNTGAAIATVMARSSDIFQIAPETCPLPGFAELVADCMAGDPASRPTFGEVCERLEWILSQLYVGILATTGDAS